jgi:regulator of protease activity HflC (stomatin/prohibitin superfamily)
VRHTASRFPYDSHAEKETSLRGSMDEVAVALREELQERLTKAGVIVEEARLSHLAYAPEIAGAMLRRQQAEAIVAARMRIVEGAVGMVELALEKLEAKKTVQLDDERKAAMVSNLLVVLCGEQAAQPVVNAGTLYS